ncbi:MAG: hypothetical protein ACI311_06775 [Bacilli bacterium]
MKKIFNKLLFALFSLSLCSCNKDIILNNDLFLGEVRAQLNTVYTINCVVEPSNHTEDVVWSSNWPSFVSIVESTNTYCKIKRTQAYTNAVGDYVIISASINDLYASCRVYEDSSIVINEDSFTFAACRSTDIDYVEDAVDFYLVPRVDYSVNLNVSNIDISCEYNYKSSDDFTLYFQDNFYHYLGTMDRADFYDKLPSDGSFVYDNNFNYFNGFMLVFSVDYNGSGWWYEYDYL